MKFSFNRKFLILLFLLAVFSIGFASAGENTTDVVCEDNSDPLGISEVPAVENIEAANDSVCENIGNSNDLICENISSENSDFQLDSNVLSDTQVVKNNKISTKINANKPSFYYSQNGQLVGYLKDNDNHALKNKKVSILLNGKTFTRVTDKYGKVVLKLNIVPNSYNVKIKFAGDENYSSCQYNTLVNIKKIPISLDTNNYKTYWKSDLFFKAKVCDKLSKKPVSGIKVLFKIYSGNSLYLNYYSTTDRKGIAYLDRNLDVGDYKIRTYVYNKKSIYSLLNSNNEATLKILPTAEVGCCSIHAQLSNDEAIIGFRRDSTYAADLYIESVKWFGRTAVKQYKVTGTYFFHCIVTSDGWSIGTGGADNPDINNAIENLAGSMVQSNCLDFGKIKTIMGYLGDLGIGHFAIKNPHGKYVVAWKDYYHFGQLNPGEYISVPNDPSLFRHGTCSEFSGNPVQIGVKIAASDYYGVNRRDITVFYWKVRTDSGSTKAYISVYATNDNGNWVGMSTAHLKDNIYINGRFFSKDSLSQSTNYDYLGGFDLGKIDYLKIKTVVSAPIVKVYKDRVKEFKVKVLNKNNKLPIRGLWIKIRVNTGKGIKDYSVKTDANGIAKYSFKFPKKGYYRVYIYSPNRNYYISKNSAFRVI